MPALGSYLLLCAMCSGRRSNRSVPLKDFQEATHDRPMAQPYLSKEVHPGVMPSPQLADVAGLIVT